MDILMNIELLPNLFNGNFVVIFELLYLLGALEGRLQLPGGRKVGLLLPLHKVEFVHFPVEVQLGHVLPIEVAVVMVEVGVKGLGERVKPEEEEGGGVQQTQLRLIFGRINDLLSQKYVGLAEGKHFIPLESHLWCNFFSSSLGLLDFIG